MNLIYIYKKTLPTCVEYLVKVKPGLVLENGKSASQPRIFSSAKYENEHTALLEAIRYRDLEIRRLGINDIEQGGYNWGKGYFFNQRTRAWIALVTTVHQDGSRKPAKMSFSEGKWGRGAKSLAKLAADSMRQGNFDQFKQSVKQGKYDFMIEN